MTEGHDYVRFGMPNYTHIEVSIDKTYLDGDAVRERTDVEMANRAVELLQSTGAANVGGLMDAQGSTPLEQAIAVIAGIGGSEARIVHRINEFLVAAAVVSARRAASYGIRFTSARPPSRISFARPAICAVASESAGPPFGGLYLKPPSRGGLWLGVTTMPSARPSPSKRWVPSAARLCVRIAWETTGVGTKSLRESTRLSAPRPTAAASTPTR